MRRSFRCNSTFSYNRVSYSFLCPPPKYAWIFSMSMVLHCYTTHSFQSTSGLWKLGKGELQAFSKFKPSRFVVEGPLFVRPVG